MSAEHWTIEDGYDSEREAMAVRHELAEKLIARCRERGFSTFTAPTAPMGPELIHREEFHDCRILVQWIPDWLPSRWAGKYAVRADTLASKEPPSP